MDGAVNKLTMIFYLGILAAVLIPIMQSFITSANMTGITGTVLTYIPTFAVLGVMFFSIKGSIGQASAM